MSSSNKDKSSAEAGIQQAGAGVKAASQMTPSETSQYTGSFDIGNILKQIMMYQQGLGGAPSGFQDPTQQYLNQTGPLGQALYGQTLSGIQDPNALYESTLQPQLQAAQDFINRGAQGRGLLRSGIPIEQMGRAGVDLAIQEAQARMQNRQVQMANAQSLGGNIQQTGQQNLANLSNLYGTQQQAGLQASGRASQGAQVAAQYQAYPLQAQLGNYYGSQGNTGAALGGIGGLYGGAMIGAALAPATGGLSLAYPLIGAGIGAAGGSQLGRSFNF